ncbi:D-ala-D-ala transporter subunit [Bacillus sp. AFS076308]|uniref:ABC transporter permease n=1 Tax=unclassified Bacillus (in: firmicutes) TaxID=185979 RepID=UPI000BF64B80|nr:MULTISPECIES: ABC transporter permease [unclassified Bacillus (in: firmicutes)]PFO01442.1 D-ala-D-ala transporter subunit [Bacillus sp. AFS076308]PGV52284.1 D-ala-D-ala transporter subunit [Bacillus sp. AFS037270]
MKEIVNVETTLRVPKWTLKRRKTNFSISNLFLYTSTVIVLFIIACAIFPKWIAPFSPTYMNTEFILSKPSADHWFGTDYFGRDVFSLVIYGSQDSLIIGVTSVLIGGIIGGSIGAFAGYIGGFVDVILMRVIDILMTIPGILLALAIAAALGPSLFNIVLAVAASAIPGYARVMRGQMMSIKKRKFVDASRSIGTPSWRIFLWHILPNSWSPLLVLGTIGLGTSILIGSGLSFLGLGTIKEIPDWGALLSQGRGYLTVAWWISTFPGLAITLFVLSINIIGDKLRDSFDPKTR